MLKYFVVIPLSVFGALGYTAHAVYGENMVSASNEAVVATVETEDSGIALAHEFSASIATLRQLTATSSLDTTRVLVIRTTIRDRFHEAFTEITRLEDAGRFAEAAPIREIMQVAIEDHMDDAPHNAPAITHDLEAFSKFMTETLIERSVQAAS